ncbi:MAG: hypothetical protein MZV63_63840 [Marinilabiliales bacterium]|nr:hypothetical protein [Marinilabiliales bacterium]
MEMDNTAIAISLNGATRERRRSSHLMITLIKEKFGLTDADFREKYLPGTTTGEA